MESDKNNPFVHFKFYYGILDLDLPVDATAHYESLIFMYDKVTLSKIYEGYRRNSAKKPTN